MIERAHRASMSKTELLLLCQYWARPDVVVPPSEAGPRAIIGNETHAMADDLIKGRPITEASAEATALFATLRPWIEDRHYTTSEMVVYYNADTCEATADTGSAGHRNYKPHDAMVLPGTLDLVRHDAPAMTTTNIDIKTGSKSNVTPAAENGQLLSGSLALRAIYKSTRSFQGLVFPLKTKVNTDIVEVSQDQLDDHAGKLRRAMRALPTSQPQPGKHCFRCPAWMMCPAQVKGGY